MLLTDKKLPTLPVGVHPDKAVPGLRFTVTKKRRSWILRYRRTTGTLKQVRLGGWPNMLLEAARHEARRLKEARTAGGDPQALVAAHRKRLKQAAHKAEFTVSDAIEIYDKEHLASARSEYNRKCMIKILERLPASFRSGPVSHVTRSDAHEILQGFKAPSVRLVAGRELRAVWNHLIGAGKAESNPFDRLKLPVQASRSRVLSLEEIQQILAWLPKTPRTAQDVVRLVLLTAMRPGEVTSAEAQHLSDAGLLLPETKNGKARTVQLSAPARQILESRVNGSKWLFPSDKRKGAVRQKAAYLGMHLTPGNPVSGWHLHDLRRTAATHLAEQGFADSDLIELILGHTRQGIRAVYNRSERAAEQRAALEVWAVKLQELEPVLRLAIPTSQAASAPPSR